MSIRTEEELNSRLSEEIAWRKKELTKLRSLAEFSGRSEDECNIYIRSGIAMLYAHWEGFVKEAASSYLEFVRVRGLSYKQLTPSFIAIAVRPRLEDAIQSKKFSKLNDILEFLLTRSTEECDFHHKKAVNTQANLSSVVFKDIIYMLNFDYSEYATKEKLLDDKLLHYRNNIAHGKKLSLDFDDYLTLHREVISLMDKLMEQICTAVSEKRYLRC